jgi:hypothetical protein
VQNNPGEPGVSAPGYFAIGQNDEHRGMMNIENTEAVTEIFGHWPSFHDAEVVSIHLNRHGHGAFRGPTVEATIHVFEMTNEIDERGLYVCRHHTLVKLRFAQADNIRIDDFNIQNALSGIKIVDISARQLEDVKFEVQFDPSFGASMDFVCKAVSVISVEPWVQTEE